jgi:hypothetical protein
MPDATGGVMSLEDKAEKLANLTLDENRRKAYVSLLSSWTKENYNKTKQPEDVPIEEIYAEKWVFADDIFWELAYFYELWEEYVEDPDPILKQLEPGILIDEEDRKLGIVVWVWINMGEDLYSDKISDLLQIDFMPPELETKESLAHLMLYAGALSKFYRETQDKGLSEKEEIAAIDFSMAKIAQAASAFISALKYEFFNLAGKKAAVDLRTKGKKKKAHERKQRILEIYYKMGRRDKLPPYSIAQLIRSRYIPTGPNEKKPSERTIVRRLREEKLIE